MDKIQKEFLKIQEELIAAQKEILAIKQEMINDGSLSSSESFSERMAAQSKILENLSHKLNQLDKMSNK